MKDKKRVIHFNKNDLEILERMARGYTDKDAERNILSNPFKRFEDMNMFRHTKTLGVIEVDSTVWKKLTDAEKKWIGDVCEEKLENYYTRIRK